MTSARSGKIEFLEAVRGIAAIVVVFQHVGEHVVPGFERWSFEYFNLGRVAIISFFMVSGFVIPLSLGRQNQRVFWIRRVFRLYPLYFFALVATLVVTGIPALPNTVINITMTQGAIGAASVIPTAWTLGIEIIFYVQCSVLANARTRRLRPLVAAGWAAIALALAVFQLVTGNSAPITLPVLILTAMAGEQVYLTNFGKPNSLRYTAVLGLGALVLSGISLVSVRGPGTYSPLSFVLSALTGALLFWIAYLCRTRTTPQTLLALGTISYGVYLLHPLIFELLSRINDGAWLFWALPAATVIVATVTYRTIEKPSQSLGRRLSSRFRDTSRESIAGSHRAVGRLPR